MQREVETSPTSSGNSSSPKTVVELEEETQLGNAVKDLEERMNAFDLANDQAPLGTLDSLSFEQRLRILELRMTSQKLPQSQGSPMDPSLLSTADPSNVSLSPLSLTSRLAIPHLTTSLLSSLLSTFFNLSCSILMNVFASFLHLRVTSEGDMTLEEKVVVASLCTIAARSSNHSAILGYPTTSPTSQSGTKSLATISSRREDVVVALKQRAYELSHALEGVEDVEVGLKGIEALLVQTVCYEKTKSKRRRSLLNQAFGLYRDLNTSEITGETDKQNQRQRIGRMIYAIDAATSAYLKLPPLITSHDLFQSHFDNLWIPNFELDDISASVQIALSSMDGVVTHEMVLEAEGLISSWVTELYRSFALLCDARTLTAFNLHQSITTFWSAIDLCRYAITHLQHPLHAVIVPHGCSSTTCLPIHFRAEVKAARDLAEVESMLYGLVVECEAELKELGLWYEVAKASFERMRKVLKALAYYCHYYLTTVDHHLLFYAINQLELIPSWTQLALTRHDPLDTSFAPDLPASTEQELTLLEIDWLREGAKAACFYTPDAGQRYRELGGQD